MLSYYLLAYMAVLLAATGQILLKQGAGKAGLNLIVLSLNRWVTLGLGIMVLAMLLNVRALSVIPLKDLAFILPTAYILTPVLAHFLLKEQLNCRTIAGTAVIIAGMIIFNWPMAPLF